MFGIGESPWPGLSKLAEEAAEVIQVIGKLMQTSGGIQHWKGPPLDQRLIEEMADLQAAIAFVLEHNPQIDRSAFIERWHYKLARFRKWHRDNQPREGVPS